MAAAIAARPLPGCGSSVDSAFTVVRKESASSTAAASSRRITFCLSTTYVAKASTTNTAVIAPVYQSVSRIRTELSFTMRPFPRRICRIAVRREYIARASPGVQQRRRGSGINLPPQPIHVDLDEIRKGIEFLIPYMLGNFCASDHATGVPRQILDQCVFLSSQNNRLAVPLHGLAGRVDQQIPDD